MIEQLIKFFVVFFVVVEPISLIPLFAGLTQGASARYKKKMAGKSATIALAICVLFALVGARFLDVMGISLSSFRIAGGTLLFLIALDKGFALTGANVISRLSGVILAALAVQFIVEGIRGAFLS